MCSIGYGNLDEVRKQCERLLTRRAVPKIKLGKSIEYDIACLKLGALLPVGTQLSADFNAAYTTEEFFGLLQTCVQEHVTLQPFVTLEQPLMVNEPWECFDQIRQKLFNDCNWSGHLVADESVVTEDDAARCHAAGWAVNYKLQKIGGLRQAYRLAQATSFGLGMVGGTFPTAVGRAYDIWASSCMPWASLPSDGWEPATDWFTGNHHLITETFNVRPDGATAVFTEPGLGVTLNADKVSRFEISDPRSEYAALRLGQPTSRLAIVLKSGLTYGEEYRRLSGGRDPSWNL
jgi:L-alanine-DL-glutamate epimerase-like enolase superfamily enzyme